MNTIVLNGIITYNLYIVQTLSDILKIMKLHLELEIVKLQLGKGKLKNFAKLSFS